MRLPTSAIVLSLLLASCGGGDGDSSADAGEVDYYSDFFFRERHPLSLMVFEGGLVYGFYQSDYSVPVFPEFVYAGFFVATSDAPHEASVTYRGIDFDFDAGAARSATFAVAGPRTTALVGELTVSSGGVDAISAWRASVASDPTDRATLGGDYDGYVRTVEGGSQLTATVTAAGRLSASTTAGCSITATLKPRALGNLYDAEATLSGSCSSPAGDYRGHAFQSYLTRNVYVMLADVGLVHGVFVQLYEPPTAPASTIQAAPPRSNGTRPARKSPF